MSEEFLKEKQERKTSPMQMRTDQPHQLRMYRSRYLESEQRMVALDSTRLKGYSSTAALLFSFAPDGVSVDDEA